MLSYNAAYASGVGDSLIRTRAYSVYMRAVVSDPFGSFDISGVSVTLLSPSGTTVLSNCSDDAGGGLGRRDEDL